ncbi:hypothetical protein [Fulvimonas yonginensis]|uniref:Uncharacterized protein n=1 Tax=Fulvimonas yonginensis TaxID=1495200 RepID=A0ABU8J9T2_9GAMM
MRHAPLPSLRSRRLARWIWPAAALLAVVAIGLAPVTAQRPATQWMRWTGAGQDWLLVADRQHDRISIYDARDGRPLGRLDRASGLADVDRLVLEGRWLVVLGDEGPRVVRLPGLKAEPLR